MAKRFIDTGLFDDEWFAELDKDCKLFWVYYLTKCDHAGLLKYNKKLIEFQTGIDSLETVIKQFGNRIVTVSEQLLFCPKFISFQYPDFPKSKVRQQSSAIDLLIKNGLWDEITHNFKLLPNSPLTVKELLPNSYGNGNDTGNGNGSATKPGNFKTKAEAFEWLKNNYMVIEEAKTTVCNLGWRAVDEVDIVGFIKIFLSAKADMNDTPDEIRKHFKNWLFREPVSKLTEYAATHKRNLK